MRSICSKIRSEGGRTYGMRPWLEAGVQSGSPYGAGGGDVVKWNDIFYRQAHVMMCLALSLCKAMACRFTYQPGG